MIRVLYDIYTVMFYQQKMHLDPGLSYNEQLHHLQRLDIGCSRIKRPVVW
jgi:hypothetical protein